MTSEQPIAAAPADINAVAPKLPLFTKAAPEAWIKLAESRFRMAGITKANTQLCHLVNSILATPDLPLDILRHTVQIDQETGGAEEVEELKKRLLDRFVRTSAEKAVEFFDFNPPADTPPLQMAAALEELVVDTQQLLKEKFFRLLPYTVAGLLRSQAADKSLTQLAREAQNHVNANPHIVAPVAPRSTKPPRKNDPSLCYYHNRYGDKAKKCENPCAKAKPAENC